MGQNLLAGTHLARQVAAGADGGWCSLELLRPELARDAELRESFLSDARRAIGLVDPRLVGTRALVADEGAWGRTTEWVDGQPLSRVLERVGRAQFPLRLQLWMICEVLAALEAAERLSRVADPPGAFVHGALSADLVLLSYDGKIRLLGAGFAATLRLFEQRLGQLALEPGYVSPERYVGSDPTPSADLYAAGALLWEALTQMDRALASSVVDVTRPRESDETPSAEEICPQAPERLKQICDRALAFDPSERYPSAAELRGEIEGFLSDTRPAGEPAPDSALAQLLLEHFAAERTALQSLIELHTSRLDVPPTVVETCGEGTESVDARRPVRDPSSSASDAHAPGLDANSRALDAPGPTLTRFTGEGGEDGTFTVTSFEEEPRLLPVPPEPLVVLPQPPVVVRVPEPQTLTPRSVQRLDPEVLSSAQRMGSVREQAPSASPAPRRFVSELRRLSGTALGVAGILALFAFAFYGVPRVREPELKAPATPAPPVLRSALLPAPPLSTVSSLEPKSTANGLPSDAGAPSEERPAPIEVAPLVQEQGAARAPAAAKALPPPRATATMNEPRWKTQFKKILRSAAPHPVAPVEPLPIDEADPYSR